MDTCEHFFVPKEKKTSASCSGTHYCSCLYCNKEHMKHVCDLVSSFTRKKFLSPIDSDIRNLTEWEEERILHIHVWDEIGFENGIRKYRCISCITDIENSTYRIQCGKTCELSEN